MARDSGVKEAVAESKRDAKATGDTMAKRKAKAGLLVQSSDSMLQRNLSRRKATGER